MSTAPPALPALPALPPVAAGALVEPYLVTIGDIGVTQHWVVTPRGTLPLAGAEWWLTERAGWTQQIPVWAVILAVVFFPLGLLFLLVKENRYASWLEVTVRSAGVVHLTAIAGQSYEGMQVAGKVAYARQLAAAVR